MPVRNPKEPKSFGLASSAFAHHYLRNLCWFLFLWVLRCFSSPRLPPYRIIPLHGIGLPHSEICGSIHMCWSPQLIAAYHVLHRLWEPRHPPCTLSYFLLPILLLLRMECFLSTVLLFSVLPFDLLLTLRHEGGISGVLKTSKLLLFSCFQLLLPICQRTF